MVPKFRCWFKDSGTQAAHMVEWDKLKEFVGLGRLFDDSKKSTLFILMQSTGLKDKNGVEIFEWDVIFYAYFETNANNRLVKFVNGQFIAELIRNGYHKSLINVIDDAEIIGNIYEHPELLEVK